LATIPAPIEIGEKYCLKKQKKLYKKAKIR
jgi:hypothetical protein